MPVCWPITGSVICYSGLQKSPVSILRSFPCSILDEVRRTHVEKLAWEEKIADSWQRAVRGAFPDTIAHEVESLIPCMTNSEKDRHVVAAAIMGKAQLIPICYTAAD